MQSLPIKNIFNYLRKSQYVIHRVAALHVAFKKIHQVDIALGNKEV